MKWIACICVAATVAFIAHRENVVPEFWLTSAPAPVQSVAPPPGDARLVFAGGIVEGPHRSVPLQFELAGRITSIPVTEGQFVEAGQVLAALDDVVLRQKVDEARANLRFAIAERDRLINGPREETRQVARSAAKLAAVRVLQAEADKNRAQRMFDRQALPEQDYDRYRFELDLAMAEYEQARSRVLEIDAPARPDEIQIADARIEIAENAVTQAQTLLEKTRLLSPLTGTILRIDAEPGQLVDPEHARPVITITNTQQLRIRAWVEEFDALSVAVGQCARIVPESRTGQEYVGAIEWLAPSMAHKQHLHHDPGEHQDVRVREVIITLQSGDGLVVGLPVDVFIDPSAPLNAGLETTIALPQSHLGAPTEPEPRLDVSSRRLLDQLSDAQIQQ